MRRALLLAAPLLFVGGCGNQADLVPAPGQPLPVKPLMARSVPDAEDLLTPPAYANPSRVDELMRRSAPRLADPFDLPPATGGAPPVPVQATDDENTIRGPVDP